MKIRSLSRVILLFVVLVGGLGFSSEAGAITFSDIDLGAAGPTGLNLGTFVTGPTTLQVSSHSTYFDTNLGLADGVSTRFSGYAIVTGTIFKDPGATVQSNISSHVNINGGIIEQDLSQAVLNVNEAATNAASLTPDVTYGAIGSSALTINHSLNHPNALGGYDTVIDVNGNITITNSKKNLTINGGVNDWFIINVNGDVGAHGNSAIVLTGGITASHVLFNIEGTHDISVSRFTLNGTFLAPNFGQKIILDNGTINGAVIGYQIFACSGPQVYGDPYIDPPGHTPIPPLPCFWGAVSWAWASWATAENAGDMLSPNEKTKGRVNHDPALFVLPNDGVVELG
jgi:hypothetical protein